MTCGHHLIMQPLLIKTRFLSLTQESICLVANPGSYDSTRLDRESKSQIVMAELCLPCNSNINIPSM